MKITRVSLGIGVATIVATILIGIGAQSAFAQGDPLLGSWVRTSRNRSTHQDRRPRNRRRPSRLRDRASRSRPRAPTLPVSRR